MSKHDENMFGSAAWDTFNNDYDNYAIIINVGFQNIMRKGGQHNVGSIFSHIYCFCTLCSFLADYMGYT